MESKTINILYWTFTILFAGLMAFTAVPDVLMLPEAIQYIAALGYPRYIIPFIGVAKLLGAVAILIPGLNKIKEWAYAGLFIDLAGATYSGLAISPAFDPKILGMLMFIIPGVLSYYFWNKKKVSQNSQRERFI